MKLVSDKRIVKENKRETKWWEIKEVYYGWLQQHEGKKKTAVFIKYQSWSDVKLWEQNVSIGLEEYHKQRSNALVFSSGFDSSLIDWPPLSHERNMDPNLSTKVKRLLESRCRLNIVMSVSHQRWTISSISPTLI